MTPDSIRAAIGPAPRRSNWLVVDQHMINLFADATGDHQFIHIDPLRAAQETPFGGTIAHGFLSLSLLPRFYMACLPRLPDMAMGINYGIDRLRFLTPVRAGSRVRGCLTLAAVEPHAAGLLLRLDCTIEIEGGERPALSCQWTNLLVGKA